MKKIELLAPAGDMEKLKTAFKFGADAVYLGGENFNLRQASKNFTLQQIEEAVQYAHDRDKKIHITLNMLPHNEDLQGLENYVEALVNLKVDALIVADPGIFNIARDVSKDIDIHISTQASLTNFAAINFWHSMGAKRAILARELSLKEIQEIRSKVSRDMEIEMFVHGAMCISYSGRCLLSNYMTGRDSNRGDCAHACRWKYNLVEEKRPGEYFPIEEDENGTFILNSKDLCLLDKIPYLIEAGVDSLKIEGRVKTQYYVGTVVRSYRQAIDAFYNHTFNEELATQLIDEIKKASHRDFTRGFLENKPTGEDQLYGSSSYIRNYDFVGLVIDYNKSTHEVTVEQRNRFFRGDTLELVGNQLHFHEFELSDLFDEAGNSIEVAQHPQQKVTFTLDYPVEVGDMIRKKV